MGGACSLGSKGTQNPVPKHQIMEQAMQQKGFMTNKGNIKEKTLQQNQDNTAGQMDSQKEKNSNYVESHKNQQVHLTNPFSTEQNGGGGDIGDQIYENENEKIYQIGRYFLENHLKIQELKGKQKWLQFLLDGQTKLRKMNEQKRNEIFTKNNLDFIVKYTEKCLTVNVSLGKESKLNEFIEKGLIPQSDRWTAWKVKLNVQKYYEKGKYQRLLRKECICEKTIKKDIGRAFPEQQFFKIDERQQYNQRYATINSSPFKDKQYQKEMQNFENQSNTDSKLNKINSIVENQNSINQSKISNLPNINSSSQIHKRQTGLNGIDKGTKNYSIFKKESGNKNNEFDKSSQQQITDEQQKLSGQKLKDQNQQKEQQLNEQKQQKIQKNSKQENNKNLSEIQKDSIQQQIDQFINGDESPRQFLSQMSNQMKINQKMSQLDEKQKNQFENNSNDANEQGQNVKLQSVGQQSLLNVLHAISNYFPNFRYTQGMNMVIGFFLLVNGGLEEEAFWMFVSLARSENYLIMGLFENYFPLIDITNFIFDQRFEEYLPNLHYHIRQNLEVNYVEWFFQWVMTFFLDKFSLQQAIRFWDFIISQDSLFSLIQISLSLLKELQNNILGFDLGQFHSLFNGFKDQHQLWDKSSPQYIDLEKVLTNAKKIKLTKQYIANQTQSYLTSQSNIITNKQRLNVYSTFFSDINQKSQIKYRQSLHILHSEINSRIIPDQQIPQNVSDDEDDDNKLAQQVKKLKESTDLPKLQNQLSKMDEKQKDLSERQVISKPQIDYISSDNEYNFPRPRNISVKSQIGEKNNNFSFLPPIRQKKKDKDQQQIHLPDEDNEPAKNKLKKIILPHKLNDDKLNHQNNQQNYSNDNLDENNSNKNEKQQDNMAFQEVQQQQNRLPQINNKSKQLKDIQTQVFQHNEPKLRHARTLSKSNNSSSEMHVTSLDQADMNQQQNNKDDQNENLTEKKQYLPFLKVTQNNAAGDQSPSLKYYFNSPNKSLKKLQRSNTQNFNKDSFKSKYGNNTFQSNQQREDNQTEIDMINKTKEIFSNQDNNQHFNFNQQIEEQREQLIINSSSNSQTTIHQNNREDDFNFEKANDNKLMDSNQMTISLRNTQNNFQKSQQNFVSNNIDNIDNNLKNIQHNRTSQNSSRPSSHYSSMEQYKRQQQQNLKQQQVNTPSSHLQNPSAFSTPKVKVKQLQPLSFSKMASVASKLQSQSLSELNNYQQPEINSFIKQDSNFQNQKNLSNNKKQSHEFTPQSNNSSKSKNQISSTTSIQMNHMIKKSSPTSNTQQNDQNIKLESIVNMENISHNELKDQTELEVNKTPRRQSNFKEEQENKFSNKKLKIQNEQTNINQLDLKNEQLSPQKQSAFDENIKQTNNLNIDVVEKDDIQMSNQRSQSIKYDQFQTNSKIQQNQKQEQLNSIIINSNKKEIPSNDQIFHEIIKQKSSSSFNQLQESPIKHQNQLILETEQQEHSEKDLYITDQQEDDNETYNQVQGEQKKGIKQQKYPQNNLMIQLMTENEQNNQITQDSVFQSELKKDDLVNSQNIQNSQIQADTSMSGYINDLHQHNISGYSIQLQNMSHTHGIQYNHANTQFQNQAKVFSANQIPSLNNSRIHDDAHSQISEISYGQNEIHTDRIPEIKYQNQDNQIIYNNDSVDAINNVRNSLKLHNGLEGISQFKENENYINMNESSNKDRNIKYDNQRDSINSNQSNQDTYISTFSIKNHFNNSSYVNQQQTPKSVNQQLTPKTNYKQKIPIIENIQNTPKMDNSTPKIDSLYQTPKTNRGDMSGRGLQTEAPFISLNNSAQIQRNYIKSNSLNQLSNVVSQNILSNLQNSPNQSKANSNSQKYKNHSMINNPSTTQNSYINQNNLVVNNNDKHNNFITYNNQKQISTIYLQEIQEENDHDSAQKQHKNKKYQGYSPVQKGINEEMDDQVQQQNRLNNSIISSKTNQSHRSRVSLANQQQSNEAENQNDILNDLSHSQFHSNSSVTKPPQKPQSTSQISMHNRKSSLNKNITQNQQYSEHPHLRIISSSAQKNLVQGSQSSLSETNPISSNQQLKQKTYLKKPQINLSPSQNIYNKQSKDHRKQSTHSSLKLSKAYQE